VSETEIRRRLEIAIGKIQSDELGSAELRIPALDLLRMVLSGLDDSSITPEDADRYAAIVVTQLTNAPESKEKSRPKEYA
jgi:hypothetical protein